MLVRATGASKTLKVKIKELGRIAKEGETFEVTSQRFNVLNGNNRFHAKFVVKAVSDGDFDYNTVKIKKDEPKKVNQDPFFRASRVIPFASSSFSSPKNGFALVVRM